MKKKAVLIDPWPASRTYLATILSGTFQVSAAASFERAKALLEEDDDIALVVVTKSAALMSDADSLGAKIRDLADVARTVVVGCDLSPAQLADLASRDIEAIPRGSEVWFFSPRDPVDQKSSDELLVEAVGRLLLPAIRRVGVEVSGPNAGEAMVHAVAKLIAKELEWLAFRKKFAKAARVRLSQIGISAILLALSALLAKIWPGVRVPW